MKIPILSDRQYEFLKFLTQIVVPAFGALYFSLAQIWGLPKAEEVVGTLVVLDTFLGAILGLSSANYKASDKRFDGHIDVEEGEDAKKFSLNLNSDPDDLEHKEEVTFKVNKPTTQTPIKKTVKKIPRRKFPEN